MELILLIVADVALGGIAWRLARKNEENTKSMAGAVNEMKSAVYEMKRLTEMMATRVDNLEKRTDKLEKLL